MVRSFLIRVAACSIVFWSVSAAQDTQLEDTIREAEQGDATAQLILGFS